MSDDRGTPVWEHLPNGTMRARWLKRGHVCTSKCLRWDGKSSYCKRFSYRPEGFKEQPQKGKSA